ncbi:MAG TPA: hypothetical protein VE262_06630 [Blastocatellia bacterium]|nr:hypothetical protein [Blastocatellia bacterium]
MVLGFYSSTSEGYAFVSGAVFGVAALILLAYLVAWYDKRQKEREEFEAWKRQKPPEVVDAQFVDVRPTNSPQLDSSKSLVRRTRVERRNS